MHLIITAIIMAFPYLEGSTCPDRFHHDVLTVANPFRHIRNHPSNPDFGEQKCPPYRISCRLFLNREKACQ